MTNSGPKTQCIEEVEHKIKHLWPTFTKAVNEVDTNKNRPEMCVSCGSENYYLRDRHFKEECKAHTHLAAEAQIPLHKKVFPQ